MQICGKKSVILNFTSLNRFSENLVFKSLFVEVLVLKSLFGGVWRLNHFSGKR